MLIRTGGQDGASVYVGMETDIEKDGRTDRHTHRWADTDRWKERHADVQKDRHYRENRETDINRHL